MYGLLEGLLTFQKLAVTALSLTEAAAQSFMKNAVLQIHANISPSAHLSVLPP